MPTATTPAASPAVDADRVDSRVGCRHCGTPCAPMAEGPAFCCPGCRTVHEILMENGLGGFYELGAGSRPEPEAAADPYACLDTPGIRDRLVDYSDDRQTRVTFRVPAIHCLACVWLLENLHRLQPGIGESRVRFDRREVTLRFDPSAVKLSGVAGLMARLGYPPDLKLSSLDAAPAPAVPRRLWLQLGVAGFAFGNSMLFSLPQYFGLDPFSGPSFQRLVGWLGVLLALPVFTYSAADYWRNSWNSLRQGRLTLEVPIALGLVALLGATLDQVAGGHGEGYADSLNGLVFFLLIGRVFQQKTFDRLAFDRDYRSFFPLAVSRITPDGMTEERVALDQLTVGDRLRLRHGELIPADARLEAGDGLVDYGFITGEAEPVGRTRGDHLYAGGRQTGGTLEVVLVKPVSQSHLTALWNQAAFRRDKDDPFGTLVNRLSPWFTAVVLLLAGGTALGWTLAGDPARGVLAFTGVLIVACPCALALAAPFALGTAVRVLGARGIYLRSPQVVESLARTTTVVFDKTGTLTTGQGGDCVFDGLPLDAGEARAAAAVAAQSTHPLSRRLAAVLGGDDIAAGSVEGFREVGGQGLVGTVDGHRVRLGSADWIRSGGAVPPRDVGPAAGEVHLAIDEGWRGRFRLSGQLRPEVAGLLRDLARTHRLALLSGDRETERGRFAALFGPGADLHFNQSPLNKLGFIRNLQERGERVLMLGDGLNDAGALRQSDVGGAVVEQVGAFSPASDVIVDARVVPDTADWLRFSRRTLHVVRASLALSLAYNVVGISFAAGGRLSPVVCAVLMPLSSLTVAALATGATAWLGRQVAARRTRTPGRSIPVNDRTIHAQPA